ncbi:MAG: threonine dehydrogenase [Thermoprotei archaeon]|nr:MAG: threonine dehydrogenase [Thermoprotei archaeon]
MKAAVLYGPKDLRIEEKPIPEISKREVLIRVKVTTICPTDLRKYLGHTTFKKPLVLGHEFSGVVEEVGEGVDFIEKGDRVNALPFISCGNCRYCRMGRHNLCLNLGGIGGAAELGVKLDGSFAEYVKVPAENVYKLGRNMTYLEGSLIEPLAASLGGLLKAELAPGESILIIGAGPMGLLQVMLAKIMGAGKIIVSDLLDKRLEYAEYFGADVVINPMRKSVYDIIMKETYDYGVDVVMLSTGGSIMASLASEALKYTAKGGRIVVFAGTWPPKEAMLDINPIHYGEKKIVGSFIYNKEVYSRALEIAASGRLELEKLITHRFSLDEIKKAFDTALSKEGLKVAIMP